MELKDGKIKRIKVTEKGVGITLEKEVHMSQDFIKMRYRVLGEALDSINEERKKLEEVAKQIKLKLE